MGIATVLSPIRAGGEPHVMAADEPEKRASVFGLYALSVKAPRSSAQHRRLGLCSGSQSIGIVAIGVLLSPYCAALNCGYPRS